MPVKLGLIVNPLAGIGGRVGLKGSDGAETVQRAFALGAEVVSSTRAIEALEKLAAHKQQIELVTYPAEMGEDEARKAGFEPAVLGTISPGHTTAEDTCRAAKEISKYPVDLLLFVGGDGTARDIYQAVGAGLPALGIPAGVKIHSSVYAINPRRAADLILAYLEGRVLLREMEVMDVDEELFRQGRVSARLYGYLTVPFERRLMQGAKAPNPGSFEDTRALAALVVNEMNDEYNYILGSGSTIKAIGDLLGIDKTLLGIDLVHQKKLIGKDLNEQQLYRVDCGSKSQAGSDRDRRAGVCFWARQPATQPANYL